MWEGRDGSRRAAEGLGESEEKLVDLGDLRRVRQLQARDVDSADKEREVN